MSEKEYVCAFCDRALYLPEGNEPIENELCHECANAEVRRLENDCATKDTEIARLRAALEKVIDDPDYAVTVVLEALDATP